MTCFRELYWIPLSSPFFFCGWGPSSWSPLLPGLQTSLCKQEAGPARGPYWPSSPLRFRGCVSLTVKQPWPHEALECQDADPSRPEHFSLESPEPHTTSSASPEVEGTQVPVRLHLEIYMVTVTVPKHKLHRISGEERGGTESSGQEWKVKEESSKCPLLPVHLPMRTRQFTSARGCSP